MSNPERPALETVAAAGASEVVRRQLRFRQWVPPPTTPPPPARSAPANVVLPRGLLVSIEAVALVPG